jgi:signal transduction histidine kinase
MIPYNPKAVDIQSVAQENIELFTPVAEAKNITLKNEILTTSPVFSDESALQTIIRNLVNNAIKFTPEGGEVSISTEEKGDKIFIKINDTGTGIAADKLEKLFSLNKQSSKGTAGEKGSGLGLMLCKELVELNKGTIQAISELGKGSSFVFSLPRE